ncbi:MAG: response regulator [Hungatella sp.]|jgi:PAS domain S-box-containing protein|nr:response regulator [Hungatella sp.]
MYHCHVSFYLIGQPCRELELIQSMAPPENFTYEFHESRGFWEDEAAKADVIVANLRNGDVTELLDGLTTAKKWKTELIVLADKDQMPLVEQWLWQIKDVWITPMSLEETRFRFFRWQKGRILEADHQETSQFLETAINSSPNLIWFKNKEGVHEKVNDSFCKAVNKRKDQVEGQGHAYIWDVLEDDPACIQSEMEVMAKGETCISEETIKTGDGLKLLSIYKSPLYNLDGSVMGTMGVAIDITQERGYEQEIINKNQTLETIFTTIDCGVMRHSADGKRILSANRAALEILGYDSLWEMATDGFDMVASSVVTEDKRKLRQAILGLTRVGETVAVEYRIRHKDGELLYVMGNVKLLEENGELVYQRFLLDCTAQKLKERQKEKYHSQLIQALSMEYSLVCFFNLATGIGRILRADDQEGQAFGLAFKGEADLADSVAGYIDGFVHEDDKETMRQFFDVERLRAKAADRRLDYVNYRAVVSGEIRYFQVKVVYIGSQDKNFGIVLGFRSVDEEIRDGMKRNALLEDALLQARRASRAKSLFLSNMSHDIRTPMNAIVGFASLAADHMEDKARVEDYLGKITSSGKLLLSLINNILDMSRIESGKLELDEKPCRLLDVIGDVKNLLQSEALEKDLTMEVETGGLAHPDIYCDSLRLNQVLLNLVGNAVRFTEKGGKVVITVAEKPGAVAGSANFEFCIEDTGIGMSQEFVKHIFEPFERENTTTLSGIAGTGLGMAITKNIVDMMNGAIEVKSKKGEGTKITVTFAFRLCQKEEEISPQETAPKETGTGFAGPRGCRLLLVEDNELNQEIAVAILEEAGLLVDVACDGQMAVDMYKKAGPGYYRLILMDVQMPVMNGYEATRTIRQLADPQLCSIPILAMTANAFEEDKQEAMRSGMNGHIAKPVDVDLLFEALNRIIA